jgi:TonB family protein
LPSLLLDAKPLASGIYDDGCASQIRVVRFLDRDLDEAAVSAVAQWRFEPGRLAGAPVDVLVTIMLDFSIR